jgi:arsenate reductase-like glutaredoxin family protein
VLVIDTPVWLNEKYAGFFHALSIVLAANNKKLLLFDEQRDEILMTAQKTFERADYATAVHDAQSLKQLMDNNLIARAPLDSFNEIDADELLSAKLLVCAAKNSRNVTFISENRELIARARSLLKSRKIGFTVIDYLEGLASECDEYCAAVRAGSIQPKVWKRI